MPAVPDAIAEFQPQLDWVDHQRQRMVAQVAGWAAINSQSENVAGLERMSVVLQEAAAPLGGSISRIALEPFQRIDSRGEKALVPVGPALRITRRPEVRPRVLLAIHMDTVYPVDGPFQRVDQIDAETLRGPAVTDAKGGLVIMLTALEALEQSPYAAKLGWEVLINPDEELGSPASAGLFVEAAAANDLGLLFEPALDHAGTLVGARRGSGNFTIVVHGKSAHAGRDFDHGRNAIAALARIVAAVDDLNRPGSGMTLNVGRIDGGGPVNVVPDTAVARLNLRVTEAGQEPKVVRQISEIIAAANKVNGIRAELHGAVHAPPKALDGPMLQLLERAAECSALLGKPLTWRTSGGVCDGNRLAARGLPNLDSLGAVGGAIHSPEEYIHTASLPERAKLVALLLLTLARGDWSIAKSAPAAAR